MQVVCGNCQLSFQAPEGAAGLMCPICRSPLRPAQAAGDGAAPNQNVVEWSGGSLDDLMAFLSGPALPARVEVLPPKGDTALGEVHLLAGGVSEALYAGKSTDDALDKLRGVNGPRFRIEPRLPNPVDGDLGSPGPESGTLDVRPLAHLMRYCEQYVITCGIEVWRGSETARVEYRKGEISGVTVGGIDAPERLAEVMQWSSGNYRLSIPRLTMPESVPKVVVRAPAPAPAAPAPVAAPASAPVAAPPARPPATPAAARLPATPPSARPAATPPPPQTPAQPVRAPVSTHATRTIFGMPALDIAGLKAAEIARQATAASTASASSPTAAPPPAAPAPTPAAPAPAPVVAASAAAQAAQDRQGATKTIFGVPAPRLPEKVAEKPVEKPKETAEAAKGRAAAESAPQRIDRKTGARKTLVPAPAIIPPASAGSGAAADAPPAAPMAAAATESAEASRTTHQGYGGGPAAGTEVVPVRVAPIEERTAPVRAITAKKSRAIPVWTYVGVGFLFGLALLGIYQLVGVLAH
jgi:hypothetical protein